MGSSLSLIAALGELEGRRARRVHPRARGKRRFAEHAEATQLSAA